MFELWFTENNIKDHKTAKPIYYTAGNPDDNSTESPRKFHNYETAKSEAKIVQNHPAFKNSATVLIYDVAKDRFIKP
jgi:hypothetical protein